VKLEEFSYIDQNKMESVVEEDGGGMEVLTWYIN
jgi:hypothetical protein